MRLIKKILGFIFTFTLFVSCTQKDKYNDYTLFVKNETMSEINIITFSNNIEVDNIIIPSNSRDLQCNLLDVRNLNVSYSYGSCGSLDSIKFIFPNGKGYLCSIEANESLCFVNEITPWYYNEKFINTTGNIFEFTINQEDYDNAYDLP